MWIKLITTSKSVLHFGASYENLGYTSNLIARKYVNKLENFILLH